jgi:hypothetical protein
MNRILRIFLLIPVAGLFFSFPVQADNTIGIYWDTEYTESSLLTDTFPSIHTGYLVLKDPTAAQGVTGWECCVGIEGPAIFVSWILEGETLNLESPPCFQVGISPAPLPVGDAVLLATFMTMVTEDFPVTYSVEPIFNATLPGQMSFTAADDPAAPLPMDSVTGNPEVAWINDDVALLEIDRDHVNFADTIVGYPGTEIVTVSNIGYVDAFILVTFSDTSGVFSLTSPGNPVGVPARSSVELEVTFVPPGGEYYSCIMNLGDQLPEVLLAGTGLAGTLSWEMDSEINFGALEVGRFKWEYLTITNTGEVPIPVYPSLPWDCTAFEVEWGGGDTNIGPGEVRSIRVTFRPPAEGSYSCDLSLGDFLPDVPLSGTGTASEVAWNAPTEMTLGPVGVGSFDVKAFQIQNTGTVPFIVNVTFPVPCGEFSIVEGAGGTELLPGANMFVRIRFEPASPGTSTCILDLGPVVPPVTLTGIARDPELLWTCPAQLDFGEVAVGENDISSFSVWNTGDITFPIDVVLPGTCPEFEITLGGGPWVLEPGSSHEVYIRFTPSVLDSATCLLDMGEIISPVLLTGLGVEPVLGWSINGPVFIPTGVGRIDQDLVTITNTGNTTFSVSPSIDNSCWHFVLSSGSFSIQPGMSDYVRVDFHPTAPGSLSCVLDLGSVLPDVALVGEAFPRPEGWGIIPMSVDFPSTFVGDSRDSVIEFHNTGGTTLSLDVGLEPESPNFSIFVGGGQIQVLPGYSHDIGVSYTPLTAGVDSTAVMIGATFPPVPVTGLAEDRIYSCLVQPDTLNFGSLVLGQSGNLVFSITNTGNQPLEVTPFFDSPHYSMAYGDPTLDPGQTSNGSITFFPQAPGFQVALVDLGNDLCLDITCIGTGLVDFQMGDNRVGMFFDSEFTALEFQTSATPEIVTGYLVFSNPSVSTGVGAWECAYDLTGNGQFLGWQFEGQAINVGDYNNLIVGIGGAPLPFGPTILLATFQVLVSNPSAILELSLSPTQFPSIPGQMVWAPGGEPGVLLPMLPVTGLETVAWINKDVTSVDLDVPAATRLLPNVPNPFNPSTRVQFELAGHTNVRVTIYDLTGRSVLKLVDEFLEAGPHSRIWVGRDEAGRQVPSGPYFVRLVTENRVDVRKILLLK